ncbi:MAG: helix-turn-helix domain-containing protein [Pseudomonadota bacterium]|nr:helix-turn-helix domain-containing protein [Pseudomonadota bacterium]
MNKDLYSIVDVADLLGLHVKTVRNYIREGRLQSTRVGKQYRIARADLDVFTGGALSSGQPAQAPVSTDVSSVVELNGINSAGAQRLAMLITGAAKGRNESQALQIQTLHDESRARLKVIIHGSLDLTSALLGMIEFLLHGSTANA